MEGLDRIKNLLNRIYGEKTGPSAFQKIMPLIENFSSVKDKEKYDFSQEDVVLITYGDTLKKNAEPPLKTFHDFAKKHLKNVISIIHFLPFFPYSSDDGFAITDFFKVNRELGSWDDIKAIEKDFSLMFDYVLNHVSAKSRWFEDYLEEKKGCENLAIEVDPDTDLSGVVRPRAVPLLTEFEKVSGQKVHLWTTFSADQIDLNYKSVDVLEKMIKVFLFYVEKGATIFRLDAIAYLWKEIGTPCIHLPQTHDMVKLLRAILDIVAPYVIILTETNVPYDENISYFGNGTDEAQMVYNFTLPPLLFYTLVRENTIILSDWVKNLKTDFQTNTFLNFTASHDGIGVRPLEGILPKKELDGLINIVKANGGMVSYKKNQNGSKSPYELNITYTDALNLKKTGVDTLHVKRFMASQAIQYALPGVPATYIHSLIGSRNWAQGPKKTGQPRSINREKLYIKDVYAQLELPGSFRSRIFYPYLEMIKVRRKQSAFHPNAGFKVLSIDPRLFAIKRFSRYQTIYAITNVTKKKVAVSLPQEEKIPRMIELLTGGRVNSSSFNLEPYQTVWLSHMENY